MIAVRAPVLFSGCCFLLAGLVPAPALAHAFAQRYDLPLWLYLAGAGAAVALSFVVMAAFLGIETARVGAPRLDLLRTRGGRLLADRRVLFAIRLLSIALFVLLLAAGFFGRQDDAFANSLPTMVWVIWWAGLAFFSALARIFHDANDCVLLGRSSVSNEANRDGF